jgi:hypothetical protein
LILAEVCGIDTAVTEDQVEIDVRRMGGVIAESYFQQAVQANPRILQSRLGYGELGQVVPEVNVVVLEPPLTLLEDYGGLLTQDQAEVLLRKQMTSSGYAVIRWVYPKPLVRGVNNVEAQISIQLTWEGVYTYKIYKRALGLDAWVDVFETIEPAEGNITWLDTDVVSGSSYQYAASITQSGIEFPMTDPYVIATR